MAQQTYGEWMRSNPEMPNNQTAVDWFCPKCDSYVSSENVTFEETHQICNTGVIIKETKHIALTEQTVIFPFGENGLPLHYSANVDECMKSYKKQRGYFFTPEQFNELHKADAMRSYRAGMMQGLRMLQSYMTFEQQARFGFHDKEDGKINALLDKEAKEFYIKTYLNK